MGVLLAVCIVLASVLTYRVAKFIRVWYLLNKFGGPPAIPLIGNAFTVHSGSSRRERFVNTCHLLEAYREQTGGLMRFWIGPLPCLWVYEANHVEAILSGSRHMDKNFVFKFLRPWLVEGLLISSGRKWHQRRKLLTPTFHFAILNNFIHVFNEQSAVLVQKLDRFANTDKPVNIFQFVPFCVLDVIGDTAMGKKINAQEEGENEYVRAVSGASKCVIDRFQKVWQWPDVVYYMTSRGREYKRHVDIIHEVSEKMIKERLSEPARCTPSENTNDDDVCIAGKRKRVAFLDLLLQMHREDASFSLKDIQEEVDTFMLGGYDTTAAAISWAILQIGLHDDVQNRLHDELDEIFGESDREVTSADLPRLVYLGCVIKESLRIHPSLPAIVREIDGDTHIDGKLVPKGTICIVSIYLLHRDPKYFPEPERFDPDRFKPENAAKRHPFSYTPFSAGPRNCIGQKFAMMELKVVLATLLRRFRIQSAQTVEEAKPTGQLIIRPDDDTILVKLSDRTKQNR